MILLSASNKYNIKTLWQSMARTTKEIDYAEYWSKSDMDLASYLNEIAKRVGYPTTTQKRSTIERLYTKGTTVGQAIKIITR